jgi:prepilin-type N-terminal cleavage/methylation domain-containing protein
MPRVDRSERSARAGFTLIEVLVALAIGALTIGGARAVTIALVDHSLHLDHAHAQVSEAINGERLLRRLVLESEAGRDPNATFAGSETQAAFDTWCRTANGWAERCRVELSLAPPVADSMVTLGAALAGGEQLTLGRFRAPVRLAFLEDAAHGGTWSARWGPSTAAPMAVGVFAADVVLIVPTRRDP